MQTTRSVIAAALALALVAGARLHAGRRADPPPGHGPPLMSQEANRAYERALALGGRLFRSRSAPLSGNGQSCASCHGEGGIALAGVLRKYPKHDPASGRVVPLEQRVAQCVQQRMRGQPPTPGTAPSVALQVYLKELR